MINSPRSLEACNRVGVEPSELYQLTLDQYKKKYPEVVGLSEKILKYRYEAEEKYRNDTIEQVKSMRNKIIQEKEKEEGKTSRDVNESKTNNGDDFDKKW